MEWLVWTGSAVTLLGVAMLVFCIIRVLRARRAGLDDTALKARLQSVVALNLGALAVSAIGLMLVVAGLLLG